MFTNSEYLYALWLLPLFVVIFVYIKILRKKRLLRFGDIELINNLMPDASKRKPTVKFVFIMLAYCFVVIGLAGPRYGIKYQENNRSGSEIIIALDVSNSMLAEDIQPNRLERAKQAVAQLIDRLDNNRIGLIVFAGQAYMQLPITVDYGSAKMFLSTISTNSVPVQGTAIGDAITLAINSFSPVAGAGKAIIIITDGENHEDNPIEAAALATKSGISVHTIGIGSPNGAPIPIQRANGARDFLRDREGNVVMTRLDENTLQEIATAGGGIYVRATNANIGLNTVYEEVEKLEKSEFETLAYAEFAHLFQWLFGLAFVVLLFELILSNRKNRFAIFDTNNSHT
jgi:Ca-activated chloride channel family protein